MNRSPTSVHWNLRSPTQVEASVKQQGNFSESTIEAGDGASRRNFGDRAKLATG
jgi:hypothetical protein